MRAEPGRRGPWGRRVSWSAGAAAVVLVVAGSLLVTGSASRDVGGSPAAALGPPWVRPRATPSPASAVVATPDPPPSAAPTTAAPQRGLAQAAVDAAQARASGSTQLA